MYDNSRLSAHFSRVVPRQHSVRPQHTSGGMEMNLEVSGSTGEGSRGEGV